MRNTAYKLILFSVLMAACAILAANRAEAGTGKNTPRAWLELVCRLEADGVDPALAAKLFAHPDAAYDASYMGRKIRALYKRKYPVKRPIKKTITRLLTPNRKKRTLYDTHLKPVKLAEIKLLYWEHEKTLAEVERKYGAPKELVAALLVVETRLGDYLGEHKAFNALASMAAATTYKQIEPFVREYKPSSKQRKWLASKIKVKSDWAYDQLKALIEYGRQNKLDVNAMPGSIYGAIGLCQFMPTNALSRGQDGDGDGRVNLFKIADAAHSIGAFLNRAGWNSSHSRKKKIRVIKSYNYDDFYAKTVLAIARRI